jgi:cysteine-rich repeat protein
VAPDQPVTCGIFCHCGYCDNDPDQPCFSSDDCPPGDTCAAGQAPVLTQGQPNACDTLLCGEKAQDECCPSTDATCINGGTPVIGECSLASFRQCNTNADCSGTNSGTCVFGPRPCFDLRIQRTGTPGPLDRLCCNTVGAGPPTCTATECDTNADCSGGNECIDAASPVSAGLFCIPPTANDAINSAGGIPGPGAIRFNSFIEVCRCGDGQEGCDEQCDDGNVANGDGCNESCQDE